MHLFLWLAILLAGSVAAQSGAVPAPASPKAAVPASGNPAVKPPEDSSTVKGTTRCAADLNLALPVTGRIADVLVEEGQLVREKDILLHLDRAAEQLDVERRRVQWQGQAELVTAKARKETAELQVFSARRIYQSSQGISREELENRELAYATTVSELVRLKTIKEMERLDYLTAKENLERRTLRAPTRGIVTRLIKQKGESVQANDAALKLCDLSRILFFANVPSSRSEYLRMGDTVDLNVGFNLTRMRGKLIFVSPVIDPASGLREVKIELLNPSPDTRPGVPATMELKK